MTFKEQLQDDELGRHISNIKTPAIKEFVIESLIHHGSTNSVNKANRVADLLLAMLKKRKQIRDGEEYSPWVEIMIAASLLHNLFYDGTLTSLFKAREILAPIASKHGIPDNGAYAIFQAIECQLGDDTPIESCRPIPSTPNELFAWSCWFIEELHGNKEISW